MTERLVAGGTPAQKLERVLRLHAPIEPPRGWRSHALALRRSGIKAARYAVLACNRPMRKWEQQDDDRATARFEELCRQVGCVANWGDPRGGCAHIVFPEDRWHEWPSCYNTQGGAEHGWSCTEDT